MAKNSNPKTPEPVVTEVKDETKAVKKVYEPTSHNPAFIVWPTDIWGVTKEFKTAVMRMASNTRGDDKKREMIDETIRIALAHFDAKFIDDKKRLSIYVERHLAEKKAQADSQEPERF